MFCTSTNCTKIYYGMRQYGHSIDIMFDQEGLKWTTQFLQLAPKLSGRMGMGRGSSEWLLLYTGVIEGVFAPPLWRLVMYFCKHNCKSPSNDYAGWHAAATTRHSYTLTYQFLLLISRCLSRPRVASRYSVWTSSYFKQLTSYQSVVMYIGR